MPISHGVGRSIAFAKEVAFGVAPAATAAKVMTRIEHTLNVSVDTLSSEEIRTDYQKGEVRNGFRKVEGDIKGELAAGQWSLFFAAALRGAFGTATAPLVAKTATPASEKTGKVVSVPLTGHTSDSFTLEDWFSDVPLGVLYKGCRVSKIEFDIKPDGYVGVAVSFIGVDGTDSATRYFTSPATVTQSAKMSGVLGKLMINGVSSAVVTGAKISIDLGASSEAVVGSNVAPDVYIGSVKVDGSLTCYFNDASMRSAANADTAMSLALRVDASSAIASDYVAIVLPAIKLSMPSIDDGEKLLTQSVNFTAHPAVFGALAATTIAIQDTLA